MIELTRTVQLQNFRSMQRRSSANRSKKKNIAQLRNPEIEKTIVKSKRKGESEILNQCDDLSDFNDRCHVIEIVKSRD